MNTVNTQDAKQERKKELVNFLRTLATNIESNNLNKSLIKHTFDFFLSYQFVEESIRTMDPITNSSSSMTSGIDNGSPINPDILEINKKKPSTQQVLRFLFLGWYCYTMIASNKNLPEIYSP